MRRLTPNEKKELCVKEVLIGLEDDIKKHNLKIKRLKICVKQEKSLLSLAELFKNNIIKMIKSDVRI